jgi:hypothetical protein
MENDIMKNTGYFHVVVCSASGKQCCSGRESTGQIDFCRPVSLTGNPNTGVTGQLPTQNAPLESSPPRKPPTNIAPGTGGTLQRK